MSRERNALLGCSARSLQSNQVVPQQVLETLHDGDDGDADDDDDDDDDDNELDQFQALDVK